MADILCRSCGAVVLRTCDGISRVARRQRANMTWLDGRRVELEGLLTCRSCGADFMFVDVAAARTLALESGSGKR